MAQALDGLITTFYQSFQRHDPDGMIACYHPEVTFHDPVFQTLHGTEAAMMWRMLLSGNSSLEVIFDAVHAEGDRGSAHWDARYEFSSTKRPVHNVVTAQFRFQDNLIIDHHDTFDLWRWAGMALGPRGTMLGWTPLVQRAIRRQAQERLRRFIAHQEART